MRILHLVDPGSPGGGACTLRTLGEVTRHLSSARHEVILLGTARHDELASRCELDIAGRITVAGQFPGAFPGVGRRALRRVVNDLERAEGRFDLVHAWTLRSAVLATITLPAHVRLGTLSVGPVTNWLTPMQIALIEHHPMPLLATSAGVREEYRSIGVPRRQISLLPPGVEPTVIDAARRKELRRRWEADDEVLVLGLLSEPTNWADAEVAVTILARLALTRRRVRLVMHHAAHRRPQAERWMRGLGAEGLLVVDDDVAEPWKIVAGLDAALLIGGELNAMDLRDAGSPFAMLIGGGRRLRPMPGVMPLLWAMAAGVPIITESSAAVRDVVEDGVSGLLVAQGDINAVCDRVMRLHDDRMIAGRLGGAAARFVREHCHISAFCVRLKQAYDLLLSGHTVRVIPDVSDPIVERARDDEPVWMIR